MLCRGSGEEVDRTIHWGISLDHGREKNGASDLVHKCSRIASREIGRVYYGFFQIDCIMLNR